MNSTKNICFFNTTKFWGGGEKWHFEAAEMMANTDNNTFFVLDGTGALSKKLSTTTVTQFKITVSNLSFLNPFKINLLKRFFRKNKIETVIFNSPNELKLGGAAAKRAGVKNIVYRRGIAVEVKKSTLNQHLFKNVVTHFIFNSNATKALLQKNFGSIFENKKTSILYNAIHFPEKTSQATSNNKQIIIGNAGRLVEQKGQRHLIEIAKILKEKGLSFKIEIAGDGPLKEELQRLIRENDLTQEIHLLGFVENMKSFMQHIDILVSTALWEGFGFVLAEAMVEKKSVLAFNLSSNPELIKEGENGFLIPEKDNALFAEKLELLINNSDQRKKMGEAGYRFALENFEKKKQFEKLVAFIS